MSSFTAPVRPVKVNRLQPVAVIGRFVGGATPDDLLAGCAILEIEDANELTSYWTVADVDRRSGVITGFAVRKFGSGEVYHLPRDLSSCDCPDRTYRPDRPNGCRHMAALRQALLTAAVDLPRPVVIDRKTERDDITGGYPCDDDGPDAFDGCIDLAAARGGLL